MSGGSGCETDALGKDAFGFFRPVKNLLFLAVAPLEDKPLAWHAVCLAAYLAAVAGVFRLAWGFLGGWKPALLAAAVWGLSPTCVSTALWMSAANISLGIALSACAFHFHERAAAKPSGLAGQPFWFSGVGHVVL